MITMIITATTVAVSSHFLLRELIDFGFVTPQLGHAIALAAIGV